MTQQGSSARAVGAATGAERESAHQSALHGFCAAYEGIKRAEAMGQRPSAKEVAQLRRFAKEEGITLDEFLHLHFSPVEFRVVDSSQMVFDSLGLDEDPDSADIRETFEEYSRVDILAGKDGRLFRASFVENSTIVRLVHDDLGEDEEGREIDHTNLHVRSARSAGVVRH